MNRQVLRIASSRAVFVAVAAFACACASAEAAPSAQTGTTPRAEGRLEEERLDEARRKEGDALLRLTDAAMGGRPQSSDFAIEWRNDFLKARPGTFVPFTVSVDASALHTARALMYVRVARRDDRPDAVHPRRVDRFPFEAAFPVEVSRPRMRISRGFTVPAGEYDVYVALRERAPDPRAVEPPRLRSAVLKQPITVPDFWTGELHNDAEELIATGSAAYVVG